MRKPIKKFKKSKKAQFFLIEIIIILVLLIGVVALLMVYTKDAVNNFKPIWDILQQYGIWIIAVIIILIFRQQVFAIVNGILSLVGVKV